jgi:hypothetical protein
MVGWQMNDELKRLWKEVILASRSRNFPGGTEEDNEIPKSEYQAPAEIRTEHLLNTSLKCYR